MIPRCSCFLSAAIVLIAVSAQAALGGPGVYDVRDHGAKGDGATTDTAAINRAVAACADAGGGQVRFPPGRYLSGTVRLRSKVALHLEAGAVLVGTTDLTAYEGFRPPEGTFEATLPPAWHRAIVLGVDVEDVAIEGAGTIDGAKVHDPNGEERMRGPHAILFGHSNRITIRDVTIRDAANYGVMIEECSQVDVKGVTITGGWDGVHFRGWEGKPCRDVSIVDCRFSTGDDAIAGRYWENTLITGCVLNSSCNGIRLIGPARGLIVHDCLFYGPGKHPHRTSGRTNMLSAVNLQPGAWDPTRGRLEDVLISDATMRNVQAPVHLSLRKGNTCGDVTIERLSATGVYGAAISAESWADEPIGRLVLRDVSVEFAGGGTAEQAGRPVKSAAIEARPLRSWGIYAHRVGEVVLDGVRLRLAAPDARPPIRCENVGRLVVHDLRHDPRAGGGEPIVLDEVKEVVNAPAGPR
ncbi:glycoside hydrolase family 28 protein [Paludisphaera mucosa]|uniref:Glycosyl hydrolase family 28-related protein n=1 Tax=Paludisphaera mucosa TaxID=3030827 RepID=A0ABT6FGF5_9BACT|nr:glycosyl hydrolase family 28-related protein [Paludisphaera mucosa]MDG3006645.1 glycosyl hydrolase family 28-related protein [Paludisphaera mucosa]